MAPVNTAGLNPTSFRPGCHPIAYRRSKHLISRSLHSPMYALPRTVTQLPTGTTMPAGPGGLTIGAVETNGPGGVWTGGGPTREMQTSFFNSENCVQQHRTSFLPN